MPFPSLGRGRDFTARAPSAMVRPDESSERARNLERAPDVQCHYLPAAWTVVAVMAFMPLRLNSSPVTDTDSPAIPLRLLYGSALS